MCRHPYRVLLVEPDGDILEMLVAALARRFNAQVTCVAGAADCLDLDMLEPHDLVIAEMTLPDGGGLELAEHLLTLRQRPVILLADELDCADAVASLRLGVRDVFQKPFAVQELLDAAHRALTGFDLRKRRAARYRKMRETVRRTIQERRDLNRRIDLICRDVVEAQRRLVHRIIAMEKQSPRRE
jgi:DNA-binding NtrC family response regulator